MVLFNRSKIESWALQNPLRARNLFIWNEVVRLSIAFFLGANLLFKPDINEVLISTIVLVAIVLTTLRNPVGRRNFRKYWYRAALLLSSSFVLFFIAGTLMNTAAISSDVQSVVANDFREKREMNIDNIRHAEKIPAIKMFVKVKKVKEISGAMKLVYILLFLVSLPLTYYGFILACSLGCSGYTVFAILAYIMSFGVFSSGLYFLIKFFRKKAQPYKELDKKGKKKEWKNFFLTWAITFGAALLAILIGNLVN